MRRILDEDGRSMDLYEFPIVESDQKVITAMGDGYELLSRDKPDERIVAAYVDQHIGNVIGRRDSGFVLQHAVGVLALGGPRQAGSFRSGSQRLLGQRLIRAIPEGTCVRSKDVPTADARRRTSPQWLPPRATRR